MAGVQNFDRCTIQFWVVLLDNAFEDLYLFLFSFWQKEANLSKCIECVQRWNFTLECTSSHCDILQEMALILSWQFAVFGCIELGWVDKFSHSRRFYWFIVSVTLQGNIKETEVLSAVNSIWMTFRHMLVFCKHLWHWFAEWFNLEKFVTFITLGFVW